MMLVEQKAEKLDDLSAAMRVPRLVVTLDAQKVVQRAFRSVERTVFHLAGLWAD